MDKKEMNQISKDILEELKEKHLLEKDAIFILRDVIYMIGEAQNNHILK